MDRLPQASSEVPHGLKLHRRGAAGTRCPWSHPEPAAPTGGAAAVCPRMSPHGNQEPQEGVRDKKRWKRKHLRMRKILEPYVRCMNLENFSSSLKFEAFFMLIEPVLGDPHDPIVPVGTAAPDVGHFAGILAAMSYGHWPHQMDVINIMCEQR